jgi:hypothetical protein
VNEPDFDSFFIEASIYENKDLDPFQLLPYQRMYCTQCMEGGYYKEIYHGIIVSEERVLVDPKMGYSEFVIIATGHLEAAHGLQSNS